MEFVLTRDAEAFAAHVEGFLADRIERNVLATVLATVLAGVRGGRLGPAEPLFAFANGADGRPCAAALRTPPWPLLSSEIGLEEARRLMGSWLEHDPAVPGVSGVTSAARAVAASWTELTGASSRLRMSNVLHVLTRVVGPPRPASGRLRGARSDPAERELLIAWERDFAAEADVTAAPDPARAVDARLASGAQLVWEDEGVPVCTLALAPQIAGTVRIGPVYTPPARRGRGYASSAVAAVSRGALARGASRCVLFTDLANPTSNKIYPSVGFRRCGDWEEHIFMPPVRAAERLR